MKKEDHGLSLIKFLKILGFGFLLFVIFNILLFFISMLTGSDKPTDFWWVGVIMAVASTLFSLWFSRLMPTDCVKCALAFGGIWTIEVAILLLAITIPNGTTNVVFGNWSSYLVFLGIFIGPLLWKLKI